jgi:hypothetical protein
LPDLLVQTDIVSSITNDFLQNLAMQDYFSKARIHRRQPETGIWSPATANWQPETGIWKPITSNCHEFFHCPVAILQPFPTFAVLIFERYGKS